MIGEASWVPFAILFLAALPIWYLWIRDRSETRKYVVEHRHVRCRTRDNQLVECTVVRDVKSGEPIGIQSCSAQPDGVRCDKSCLPLFVQAA
jgi:hypothetical protein